MTMRGPMSPKAGLYAIFDLDAWRARGVDPVALLEPIADALLAASPAALQLRAKHEGARTTLDLLRRLAPRARACGVPLFANDRPDLALLAGADGVHVGQDDLPVDDARRVAPALLLGVSTHDARQLELALDARPTYVAYGPLFATRSKENPDPVVGLAGVRAAVERARPLGVPIVAIGGIDRARIAEVAAAGVRLAAVISDLVVVRDGAPDFAEVTARAQALGSALSA